MKADDGGLSPVPPLRAAAELALVVGLPTAALLAAQLGAGGRTARDMALGGGGIAVGVLLARRFLRRDGSGWAGIGLDAPERWGRTLGLGAGVAVATWIGVTLLFRWLVVPYFELPPPDVSRFRSVRGDPALLATGLLYVWTFAAVGEEVLYRGFLMSRVAALLGGTRSAWGIAAASSALLFGLMHFYQGPGGIIVTGAIGLAFALAYLRWSRELWIPVVAHGLIDTTSFVALYLGAGGA